MLLHESSSPGSPHKITTTNNKANKSVSPARRAHAHPASSTAAAGGAARCTLQRGLAVLGAALMGAMVVNVLTFQPGRATGGAAAAAGTAGGASWPSASQPGAGGGLLDEYLGRLQSIVRPGPDGGNGGSAGAGDAGVPPPPPQSSSSSAAAAEEEPSSPGNANSHLRGPQRGEEEQGQEQPPAAAASSSGIGSEVDMDAALAAAKARIREERARAQQQQEQLQQEQQQQEPEQPQEEAAATEEEEEVPESKGDDDAAAVVPAAAAAAAEEEGDNSDSDSSSDSYDLEAPTYPEVQPAGAEAMGGTVPRPPLSTADPPPLHRRREEVKIQKVLLTVSSTDRGQRINDVWQVGRWWWVVEREGRACVCMRRHHRALLTFSNQCPQNNTHAHQGDKLDTILTTMREVVGLCERGFDLTVWFIAAWKVSLEEKLLQEALTCRRIGGCVL